MITTDFIVNIFTPQGFIGLMQFLTVILQILYVLFAFITIKQVKLMNHSFQTEHAGLFSTIAVLHFFAAIALVGLSLLIL